MENTVIHEVGMRDGLQMEKQTVPTETKIKWIESLYGSGIDVIQVGSFVHPVKMPQMADTDELFRQLLSSGRKPGNVLLSGLVLNEKGMERGMDCGVEMFCMGASASETHSVKNTGMPVAEAVERIIKMARQAMEAGKMVQVSVQSAFGCGFEGPIPEDRVISIAKRYIDAGISHICLADTAGHANPAKVERMFGAIFDMAADVECAAHFHNTYGSGMANCYAAMKTGVKYIETAFGGLGGCPFTKVAAGNVCTEDYIYMIHGMGLRQDIDIRNIVTLSKEVSDFLGKELPGNVYKIL